MQDKIFQKLKTSFSALGLSADVFQAQASALAATGLVNDDNMEQVVAQQKPFLESLQKENDRRASQAKTSAETAVRKEYEAKVKELEDSVARLTAKGKEVEKPEKEAPKPVDAPPAPKADPETVPEWYATQEKAHKDLMDKLTASNAELAKQLKELQAENKAAKEAKAAADRQAMIVGKAKELGIPEWRIGEGFNIAADADETAIASYLTTVTNNIKAQTLPTGGTPFALANADVTKTETDAIAKSLIV